MNEIAGFILCICLACAIMWITSILTAKFEHWWEKQRQKRKQLKSLQKFRDNVMSEYKQQARAISIFGKPRTQTRSRKCKKRST